MGCLTRLGGWGAPRRALSPPPGWAGSRTAAWSLAAWSCCFVRCAAATCSTFRGPRPLLGTRGQPPCGTCGHGTPSEGGKTLSDSRDWADVRKTSLPRLPGLASAPLGPRGPMATRGCTEPRGAPPQSPGAPRGAADGHTVLSQSGPTSGTMGDGRGLGAACRRSASSAARRASSPSRRSRCLAAGPPARSAPPGPLPPSRYPSRSPSRSSWRSCARKEAPPPRRA